MKLKGGFTLEAAVVFPVIASIIVGIIILDFTLHDKLLSDVSKILGGIRYHEAESFYYDAGFESISLQKIACSPIFGEDAEFANKQKQVISNLSVNFYLANKIGYEPQFTKTDIGAVLDINDNASVVRSGKKLIQVIGED
ncbi:MAG: hypothetical protein HDT13_03175 [Butyrivibrio sp.]|nr:hypothetical protein [Butyrivibrio sp.]